MLKISRKIFCDIVYEYHTKLCSMWFTFIEMATEELKNMDPGVTLTPMTCYMMWPARRHTDIGMLEAFHHSDLSEYLAIIIRHNHWTRQLQEWFL